MDGYTESSEDYGSDLSMEAAILTSRQILAACGPGRILHVDCGRGALVKELLRDGADAYGVDGSGESLAEAKGFASGRCISGSILNLPFSDDSFDTIVCLDYVERLSPHDLSAALSELYRVCRRHVYLMLTVGPGSEREGHLTRPRSWWENRAFEAGFRKHPYYYSANSADTVARQSGRVVILLEKISSDVLRTYSLANSHGVGPVQMDPSRETGAHADAYMARYTLVAEWVRPGDTVLDCACESGYGSAMLAAISRGKRFIGIDSEENAVSYAQNNFGNGYGISYLRGDAEEMSFLPDAAIDTMVWFGPSERLPNVERFLTESRRVIRPDGRLIISIIDGPKVDIPGDSDHPLHDVFNYAKARATLEENGFMVEARYAYTAPVGMTQNGALCALDTRPLSPAEKEGEVQGWIIVASANPLAQTRAAYSHPAFQRSSVPGGEYHVTDFGKHYRNPWLYRPLVQMGERLRDPEALGWLAQTVLGSEAVDSADYGAALTVKGYRILSDKDAPSSEEDAVLKFIDEYLDQANSNPHVIRWKVSLAFLAALLSMTRGNHPGAMRYFTLASHVDPCAFSPLLATKVVSAQFWRGILSLTRGDVDSARTCFESGVEAARRALHASDINAIGNPRAPLPFGFPELAEVADMASQCANALNYLDEFNRSPGKFWRAVDTRRFGLATWALNVQSELENANGRMQAILGGVAELDNEKSSLPRAINAILARLFGVKLVRVRILERFRINKK